MEIYGFPLHTEVIDTIFVPSCAMENQKKRVPGVDRIANMAEIYRLILKTKAVASTDFGCVLSAVPP